MFPSPQLEPFTIAPIPSTAGLVIVAILAKSTLSAPDEVKGIVLEMNYQLGVTAFSKFKKTIKYIKVKDYKSASNSKSLIAKP